jgi:hypothetical protein
MQMSQGFAPTCAQFVPSAQSPFESIGQVLSSHLQTTQNCSRQFVVSAHDPAASRGQVPSSQVQGMQGPAWTHWPGDETVSHFWFGAQSPSAWHPETHWLSGPQMRSEPDTPLLQSES